MIPAEKIEKITFKKFVTTIGNLPSSYVESLSYYECILWLCNYLENTVIPAVNNNGEAVEELQNLFVELKSYVDNYLTDENLQPMINEKLDEMAEDGTLADIVAQYVELQGLLTYNSVEEMKNATNITNGSFLQTYGYYTYGDGGQAKYKARTITNNDTIDNQFIISLADEHLIAELIIPDKLNIKQIGAIGDGTTDNHDILQNAIIKTQSIYIPEGNYLCDSYLNIQNNLLIEGESQNNYNGSVISYITFTSDGFKGDNLELNIKNLGIKGTEKNGIGFYNLRINISYSSISDFNYAFQYIKVSNINNCDIYNNNRGIGGVADSEITNNYIYQNEEGIYLLEGSNDNIICNNKIEWNTANGIRGVNSYHNIISNNIFDRNTNSGIFLYLCHKTNITNNVLRRNCIDTTQSVNSAQILISSCDNIIVNSNVTNTGTLQDGSGDTIPQRSLQVQSSNNLTFIGNDFTGGTAQNPIVLYSNDENTTLWFNNSGTNFVKLIVQNQIKSKKSEYINAGVTKTANYTTDSISAYSSIYKKFRIKYSNTYNTLCNTQEFYVTILNRSSSFLVSLSTSTFDGITFTGSYSGTTLTLTSENTGSDNLYYELEELEY